MDHLHPGNQLSPEWWQPSWDGFMLIRERSTAL
jgi:hypothetical protein